MYGNYIKKYLSEVNMYTLKARSWKQPSGNQRSFLRTKCEVQLGVCRLDSRSPTQKWKKVKKEEKNLEKNSVSRLETKDVNLFQRLRLISQGEKSFWRITRIPVSPPPPSPPFPSVPRLRVSMNRFWHCDWVYRV